MKPTVKVRRLINFNISVTWIGGMYTCYQMLFFNSESARYYATEVHGIEPKIKVEPCVN
ncbi:hypothetical protein BCL69_107717 [Nitrosomonas communis]|uniref:Uncharacterized protein n=1 Tax=Nitrosomonas communis TaxID=44574 RepID=A0A5D3YC30_9PROT|nr:hypothetical protein BCL69_107717 [Nitrosomonas communis]